jgi:hypothetical protein
MIFPITGASYLPVTVLSSGIAAIDAEGNALQRSAFAGLEIISASATVARAALDAGISLDRSSVAAVAAGDRSSAMAFGSEEVVGHSVAEDLGTVDVGARSGPHAGARTLASLDAGQQHAWEAIADAIVRGIRTAPPARASADVAAFDGQVVAASLEARLEEVRVIVAALDAGVSLDALALAGVDIVEGDGFEVVIDIIDEILASARGDAC